MSIDPSAQTSSDNYATIWKEDLLDRKENAHFLTNYLTKRYTAAKAKGRADTIVLNIRAQWGFGKTFFVERWIKELKHSGYPVVAFDAWTNDFSEDPLIGFIAAIDEALTEHYKKVPNVTKVLDRALSAGRKLIKPVSLGIAGALTKKLADLTLDEISDLLAQPDEIQSADKNKTENSDEKDGDNIVTEVKSVVAEAAAAAVKEHLGKKETIAIFRDRLKQLINVLEKEAGCQLPIFIFIDELDRCRPNYAIELLEAIKHLFGVPGIYFIASTNLDQLIHSVRAIYGEGFDAEHYLKRFFDQEYFLPAPDGARYTKVLFDRYMPETGTIYIDSFLQQGPAIESQQKLFTAFTVAFELDYRGQDQAMQVLQAVLLSWPEKEQVVLPYLLFLIFIRQRSTSAFQALSNKNPRSRDELTKILAPLNLVDEKIKTHPSRRTGDDGTNTITELAEIFHAASGMTTRELYEDDESNEYAPQVRRRLADIAGEASGGPMPTYSTLKAYHKRVSQAGQLINFS
ncbi:P-loop NTPase fold protein [Noviherbaspirillum sp. CPCC 100848]|uniref:P-loop NTPase fold protein n=1 Tax=Noviherbaspirillum album TaxID=3080276 RepID=A0ABU6JIA6_9BURK|nr:P-loop NTPase fold protein [Noviherbaspirillum sp. CPCC 100848]MEC4723422.1 P-loop NTPase fold protein [Noviherbaspirillum sp. CPCC 100848]